MQKADLRTSCSAGCSTSASHVPPPARSVTKAMLNRATQLLAREPRLQRRGITVSVVTPGWVRVLGFGL